MLATSRPAVHPVNVAPESAAAETPPPRMAARMKDVQGMPATPGGLALRIAQATSAAVAIAVMISTPDFASANAFRYLIAAAAFQVLWSLSLACLDVYALLVKRCLRNPTILCFFTIGDGITAVLMFGAACSSAGITVLLGNDLNTCGQSHCTNFELAAAMAFLGSFAVSPSFFLNFWSLAAK